MNAPIPLEEVLRVNADTRKATIGLPASESAGDHRFPLTPEGAGQLVERGFRVLMQHGGAAHIHYTDEAYARCGVELVERAEALGADIIVYLAAPSGADSRLIKRGALLLTFMQSTDGIRLQLEMLLRRHVIVLDLGRILDEHGNRPFADIRREIDGRAAIAVAS